jgi:hypothetical protein
MPEKSPDPGFPIRRSIFRERPDRGQRHGDQSEGHGGLNAEKLARLLWHQHHPGLRQ